MSKHFIVLTLPSWGHCRPETCLSLRLLALHKELLVTIARVVKVRAEAEMAQSDLSSDDRARLRVVYYDLTSAPPGHPTNGTEDDGMFARWCEWCSDHVLQRLAGVFKVSGV